MLQLCPRSGAAAQCTPCLRAPYGYGITGFVQLGAGKIGIPGPRSQKPAIEQTTLQPADSHESAIVASLAPEAYTAIVRAKNNGTGNGLVEVHKFPSSSFVT
jgi:hypothetical protein